MPFGEIRERLDSSKQQFRFVPEDVLLDLFSQQAIEKCVKSLDSVNTLQAKSVAKDVLDKATRVFAILIYINRQEKILEYLYHGVCDSSLPLFQKPSEDLLGAQAFLHEQWSFIAPKLERGKRRVFHKDFILPFVKQCAVPSGADGSYGIVDKVFIRASHQNFFDAKSSAQSAVVVARKTIRRYGPSSHIGAKLDDEFKREESSLSLITQKQHPAIIELLYSFKQEDQFCFLFPFEDKNLEDLFQSDERPPLLQRNEDLYRAIGGVGGGLEAIQQLELEHSGLKAYFIGCHHDLKPRNILVRGRCFLISDFGLAHFEPVDGDLHARVREGKTNRGSGTEEYGPPEKDDQSRSHDRNPYAGDFWSFGCILLELLIYAVKGRQSRESFRLKRRNELWGRCSDDCFHIGNQVKNAVSEARSSFSDTEPLPTAAEMALLGLSRELMNASEPLKRLDCQISKTVGDILARHPSNPWDLEYAEQQLRAQRASAELHLKALENDESGFSGLLEARGPEELETEDEDGRLPLHWAALAGSNSIANLICSQDKRRARRMGRKTDKGGQTPLSIAARSSRVDIFRTLASLEDCPCDAGHPLFLQDANAMNPLHHAAEVGCSDIVRQITDQLGEGSDGLERLLLCKDKRGRIPLHYAAELHFCGAADAILRSHPNLRCRMLADGDDEDGMTPADCANRVGNPSLAHSA